MWFNVGRIVRKGVFVFLYGGVSVYHAICVRCQFYHSHIFLCENKDVVRSVHVCIIVSAVFFVCCVPRVRVISVVT